MEQRIVSVAEMAVSSRPDEVLVTYSLGSCLGLVLYDPVERVGGLLHSMLPLSKIDPPKAAETPCMFADLGVAKLLETLFGLGVRRRNLTAKVAGCGTVLDEKGFFRIGERNLTVARKVLWKNGILIAAEDTGGTVQRTVSLHVADGRTVIKSGGVEREFAGKDENRAGQVFHRPAVGGERAWR